MRLCAILMWQFSLTIIKKLIIRIFAVYAIWLMIAWCAFEIFFVMLNLFRYLHCKENPAFAVISAKAGISK